MKKSFVPKREGRELKELTRYRSSIVEERAREYNRLDKVLQGASIKLSSVASTIDTKSGLAMCRTLSEGVTDESVLAAMAQGTMKSKEEHLRQALKGLIQPYQRLMLKSILTHIDLLSEQIAELDKEIEGRLSKESELIELLDEITGVGRQSAQVIIAEIGTDMSQFPSTEHLTSWAGLCPGNHESAGKKKSGRTRNPLKNQLFKRQQAIPKPQVELKKSLYTGSIQWMKHFSSFTQWVRVLFGSNVDETQFTEIINPQPAVLGR